MGGAELDRDELVLWQSHRFDVRAPDTFIALHRKQVLSYLRTMNLHVGLLINFNSAYHKGGVKRVAL